MVESLKWKHKMADDLSMEWKILFIIDKLKKYVKKITTAKNKVAYESQEQYEIYHNKDSLEIYLKSKEKDWLQVEWAKLEYEIKTITLLKDFVWKKWKIIPKWEHKLFQITNLDNHNYSNKNYKKVRWIGKLLIEELKKIIGEHDIIKVNNWAAYFDGQRLLLLKDYYTKQGFIKIWNSEYYMKNNILNHFNEEELINHLNINKK